MWAWQYLSLPLPSQWLQRWLVLVPEPLQTQHSFYTHAGRGITFQEWKVYACLSTMTDYHTDSYIISASVALLTFHCPGGMALAAVLQIKRTPCLKPYFIHKNDKNTWRYRVLLPPFKPELTNKKCNWWKLNVQNNNNNSKILHKVFPMIVGRPYSNSTVTKNLCNCLFNVQI